MIVTLSEIDIITPTGVVPVRMGTPFITDTMTWNNSAKTITCTPDRPGTMLYLVQSTSMSMPATAKDLSFLTASYAFTTAIALSLSSLSPDSYDLFFTLEDSLGNNARIPFVFFKFTVT